MRKLFQRPEKMERQMEWNGRTDIVKILILSDLIYRCNTIIIKILARNFIGIKKIIIKKYIYIYKWKGISIAKLILKKNKEEGILLPDFMTYHAATLIKTYCWINGLENPETELYTFCKTSRKIHKRKFLNVYGIYV